MRLVSAPAMLLAASLFANNPLIAGGEPASSVMAKSLQLISQCSADKPHIELIERPVSLQALMNKLRLPMDKLALDLTSHSLLVVYLGHRPNPGYQLRLLNRQAEQLGGLLRIEVERVLPLPDMIYPQVLVSPCMLLEIPKGSYTQIEVVDQYGERVGLVQ